MFRQKTEFEIDKCDVSGNFGPGIMLSFLIANVLDSAAAAGVSGREQVVISGSTLGEWADFWRNRGEAPPGFHALQNMPQAQQARVAAGFQLFARKPVTSG